MGVLLENLVALCLCGVLQLEDGLRVEKVRWTLAAPLHFATNLKRQVNLGCTFNWVGSAVTLFNFLVQNVQSYPAKLGGGAGEVFIY